MKIGYARVSTTAQNLDPQIVALESAGCERIYTDTASGAKAERAGLGQALDHLRSGDSLVVWKLDRAGRSLKNLIELVESLSDRGINFVSLTDQIDTSTSAGQFFFHVIASLAEMERQLLRERTKMGLENARRNGRIGGRPSVLDAKKLQQAYNLIRIGVSKSEVAKTLGVSRATLYRHIDFDESI